MKLKVPGTKDILLSEFIDKKIDDTRFRYPDGETDGISDMLARLLHTLVAHDRLTPGELAVIVGDDSVWSEGLGEYVRYDDPRVRFIR